VKDLLLWVPLLVLPVVLLLGFSGCGRFLPESGDDATTTPGGEQKEPGTEQPSNGGPPPPTGPTTTPVAETPYRDVIGNETTLMAWWRFAETGGTTVLDTEGGRVGTCIDGVQLGGPSALEPPTPPDPVPDHSAGFDGDRARVDVPHDPLLNPPVFTVEVWMRPTGAATGASQALVSSVDGNDGFELRLLRQATPSLVARIGTGNDLRALDPVPLGPPLSTGWHHVALVYDAQKATVYLDGVVAKELVVAHARNLAREMHFGADDDRRDGEFFAGDLDEVAIYNSALGPGAITAHIAGGA
jgi:Concanavalin A-like lectin/glucanases superfamily